MCTKVSPEYSNVFELVVYILSREAITILLTNNVYCSAELGASFNSLLSKLVELNYRYYIYFRLNIRR